MVKYFFFLLILISLVSQAEDEEKNLPASDNWIFLLPAFVVHGVSPTKEAASDMPRKLDSTGRSVATPGFGFEYRGQKSFDFVTAFVKDCYDNYAGTIQVGQSFKWRETSEYGYTLGLYVRQTPISCLTQTVTETSGGGGVGIGPIGSHTPPHTNTFTSRQCLFQDNLPFRYTTKAGNGYIDIIPTPFLNFSTQLYHRGSFDVNFKLMSNIYLNEFGLSFPF
jgi:hypothetical protein